MRFLYQWIEVFQHPPRWMAFTVYVAERNKLLFVAFPLNLAVALAYWLNDQWAKRALARSWIDEEVERRVQARDRRWR